jgi:hypothetical protein
MTRVLARFRLQTPLTEVQWSSLSDARGVYGVMDIEIDEASGRLAVEYDATRLNAAEVAALLHRAGIAAVPE